MMEGLEVIREWPKRGKVGRTRKGRKFVQKYSSIDFHSGEDFLPAGGCLQVCKCVQTNKIKGFLHHKCVHKRVQSVPITVKRRGKFLPREDGYVVCQRELFEFFSFCANVS